MQLFGEHCNQPGDAQAVGAHGDAHRLAGELDAAGLEILFDDRKASPGVKFKDAELLGMPTVVVVGRGWADGTVEIRDRATGEAAAVPIADAVSSVLAAVAGE